MQRGRIPGLRLRCRSGSGGRTTAPGVLLSHARGDQAASKKWQIAESRIRSMTTHVEPGAALPNRARVVVSILNWNNAPSTLSCIHSLLASTTDAFDMRVTVVDNGSDRNDWMALSRGLGNENIQLIRLETNIGFAAGHNIVIRSALNDNVDYVWLLNNDTWIPEGTLQKLVRFMDEDPTCGATSPVIYALHDSSVIDFCGVCHDWKNLRKIIPIGVNESRQLEASNPGDMGLYGTALMLRTAALQNAGLLNEDYFAYYEDDDINRRISDVGWKNRMCFNAAISHRRTPDSFAGRPDYYFYLMSRNDLFFWVRYGRGSLHKKLIRLRLVSRSLIRASRLRSRGMLKKSESCLLGIHHGLTQRGGAPNLDGGPPSWMLFVSRYVPRILLKCLA